LLFSSQKKFKDKHRNLSRSRFINAQQSESKAKVDPQNEKAGSLKNEHC
jgi:hypothetical protein